MCFKICPNKLPSDADADGQWTILRRKDINLKFPWTLGKIKKRTDLNRSQKYVGH